MSNKKCCVEVFSRVTGFFRPVQEWNQGKSAEFNDRMTFKLDSVDPVMEQSGDISCGCR